VLPTTTGVTRDRLVVLHDVDERPLGAALDGRRGRERRVGPGLDGHPHVDELVREEHAVGVREFGLELDRAGRGVDLVVRGQEPAGAELFLLRAVERVDGNAIAGPQALHHARQRIFGDREHDADRRELRDHHDAGRVRRAHDVARVDLAQADAAADRSDHARVGELQLRIVDVALIGLHRGLVLAHQRLLRVDLLLRNRILCEQRAIALDVDAGVLEQRLVAPPLSGGERQLHLERSGVDLRQEVARLHHLALFEHHLHQLAVDAAPDDDGIDGRHGAEREEVDVERARAHGRGDDRRGTLRRIALGAPLGGARPGRLGGGRRPRGVPDARRDRGDHEQCERDPPPLARRRCRGVRRRRVGSRGRGEGSSRTRGFWSAVRCP
jgi:hypothetical protein